MPFQTTSYLMIILACGLFSCSSFEGSIEERDHGCENELPNSKKVFLVNESPTKKYKFTVKSTETANDTFKAYSTQFFTLEAGDEIFLGCNEKLGTKAFGIKKIPVRIDTTMFLDNHTILCTLDTSILKSNLPLEFIYNENIIPLEDVNKAAYESQVSLSDYVVKAGMFVCIPRKNIDHATGKTKEMVLVVINDFSAPLPRTHYKTEFTITGQVQINEKIK